MIRIYEGFSDWKKANMPVFDTNQFRADYERLIQILYNLKIDGELTNIKFGWIKPSNQAVILMTTDEEADNAIDIVSNIQKTAENAMGENFAEQMHRTYIVVEVAPNKYFEKYVDASINVNRTAMQQYDFIKAEYKNNSYILRITTDDIMNYFNQVIEFFN